jgi:hypothetical protein
MVRAFIGLVAITVMTISTWVVTVRMRRRMRKSLGRNATDLELVSLRTWMQVDELEQRAEESKPNHPS